jgi:hypothetical protein
VSKSNGNVGPSSTNSAEQPADTCEVTHVPRADHGMTVHLPLPGLDRATMGQIPVQRRQGIACTNNPTPRRVGESAGLSQSGSERRRLPNSSIERTRTMPTVNSANETTRSYTKYIRICVAPLPRGHSFTLLLQCIHTYRVCDFNAGPKNRLTLQIPPTPSSRPFTPLKGVQRNNNQCSPPTIDWSVMEVARAFSPPWK